MAVSGWRYWSRNLGAAGDSSPAPLRLPPAPSCTMPGMVRRLHMFLANVVVLGTAAFFVGVLLLMVLDFIVQAVVSILGLA